MENTAQLNEDLQNIIDEINDTLNNILPAYHIANRDVLLTNGILNNNINTFPVTAEENRALILLTEIIENILSRTFSTVGEKCRKYLLNLLHEYHFNKNTKKFQQTLSMNNLHPFLNDLQALQASLKAFEAAGNGNMADVRDFIEQYPQFKNKPGISGVTLLYSAAKNNKLDLVRYLVDVARCSINAQNREHVERLPPDEVDRNNDSHHTPRVGSTALHGACFYGHLEIVKYLVEHGADYYITNYAKETPITNANRHENIKEFFRNYLIVNYTLAPAPLPERPIIEGEQNPIEDCRWEYKPFRDTQWFSFCGVEANELSRSLKVQSNEQFQEEIHLKLPQGIYNISMIKFLRSGRNQDPNVNLAWIRCRGSSIFNFDCYSIWQIMFTKHPSINSNDASSLEILEIPSIIDSSFKLQANAWYNCSPEMNSKFNKTINYRQKILPMKFSFINELLKFDFQTFEFSNDNRTILGCIRWIPKLISTDGLKNKKIIPIDNFKPTVGLNPRPMISIHKNLLINTDDNILTDEEYQISNDIDDNNQSDDYEGNLINPSGNAVINYESSINEVITTNEVNYQQAVNDQSLVNIEDYVNAKNEIVNEEEGPREHTIDDQSVVGLQEATQKINSLEEEKKQLETEIKSLKVKQNDKRQEHELNEAVTKITELENKRQNLEDELTKLRNIQTLIYTTEYTNIQSPLIIRILLSNFDLLINTLKRITQITIDQQFIRDLIPSIIFKQDNDNIYRIVLKGFQEHFQHFRKILFKLLSLCKSIKSAKSFYERKLNKHHIDLMKICNNVPSKAHFWNLYVKLFSTNIQEQIKTSINLFNDYLDKQAETVGEKLIEDLSVQSWREIHNLTNEYLQEHFFLNKIDSIKHRTLELFVEQNISYQRIKTNKELINNSASVAKQMIDKVIEKFRTESKFQGYELQQIQLIPSILQQINIYYSCFTLQLPLFKVAIKLLKDIEEHTVTTITTSTGTGKSSLLPALLLAEGYDKILITQPRRLPCQKLSQRVNETMTLKSNNKQEDIAGWVISGAEYNPNAKILYMTDGLLRERLLYDEHMISMNKPFKKGLIIFLDEVHERSINIDLCLALLARLLTRKPELKSKLKIIISSATLNTSVADRFQAIPNISVARFPLSDVRTPYEVGKHSRKDKNILDIVQELYKTCQKTDQILCFVNSALEATQYCKLLSDITKGAIKTRVLIQSQSPRTQNKNIEEANVLFSTTIAETSLTFPSLRYVIDTGYINLPIYNSKLKRTILTTIPVANSTIAQRSGRLGRTQPGDYYALFDLDVGTNPFPIPQICLTDLTNIEFLLRRSPLKCGLNTMQQYLPDRPSQESINYAIDTLRTLKILEASPSDEFTSKGKELMKIPDFGSLSMSISVLSALRDYNCGYDLICLSSILGVLNTTSILTLIPSHYKCPEGDFMTLYKLMDDILSIKQSIPSHQFDLNQICQGKGLLPIKHIIGPAIRRYTNLEKSMNLSNDYRQKAHIKSDNWEFLAKSLLTGYSDNIFISCRELQERNHLFNRAKNPKDIAMLDLKSTLTRSLKQEPVPLVLVRDVLYSTAVRERAILSFVGEIKLDWMEYQLKREINLIGREENFLRSENRYHDIETLNAGIMHMNLTNNTITLSGTSGLVINTERNLRQKMINVIKFQLENSHTPDTTEYNNLSRNLAKVSKMLKIFHPMIWRWKLEKQIDITVTPTKSKSVEIIIKGRDSEIDKVKKEFDSFKSWLANCAVIQNPDAGVPPRILYKPMRNECTDIEERISHITDSKRTRVDLHNGIKGNNATRETRMEVVAWIAVCKFNCKIEGGFVRDWIVGKYIQRPQNLLTNPINWIQYQVPDPIPYMHREVVPADLDCHLPQDMNFDIEKFQDELHKYDIKCKVFRQSWRYILLIDEYEITGPFTMDLIEPHVALTHDRIDFDVSNLYLEKDYTREIGMRVDIQQRPYSIELESIIDNIKNKRFRVLRSEDHTIQERIDKMTRIRGWTQFGETFPYLPSPDSEYRSVLVPLLSSSVLYKDISEKINNISNNIHIKSIEQIRNPLLEDAYEAMKEIIADECPGSNPNEQELFHGTSGDAIQGIIDNGFDDRYFADGMYGHGAYFADNPLKSHGFTDADPVTNTRVMFYNKVLIGKPYEYTTKQSGRRAAPIGFHSVIGKHEPSLPEYIVYRYGQALPYMKIVYRDG